MFYGYYGFTQIRHKESLVESKLIVRVFNTALERGQELAKCRRGGRRAAFTPFAFTNEVCERLNIKTIEDCIRVFEKAYVLNRKLPILEDEAQAFMHPISEDIRKRISCRIEQETQIHSTILRYNFSPTWQEQIEKIQPEGLTTQREKDIYFYGKFNINTK